jgi:octanoyl-[GcvH]:protein N-octanoyltransferase
VFGRRIVELDDTWHGTPATAVAFDDVLAAEVGRGDSPPTLRIWQNGRALVAPRWRIDGTDGGAVMDRNGAEWPICGRSSGGATVAHGPGTLNVSIILPLGAYSIADGFSLWIGLLATALRSAYGIEIEAAIVEGAFCSGRYDASVAGRKLAGVSQGRRRGAMLVHGTILASVDARVYVGLIEAAERILGIPNRYEPDRIVSLAELTGFPVPAEKLARDITGAAE